ncbi:MAG: hypothetical protein ACHQNT_03925 [Bacteroidia bacterium]
MKTTKEKRLEIRATDELKQKLNQSAEQSKRTPSDYLRLLIEYAHTKKIKL